MKRKKKVQVTEAMGAAIQPITQEDATRPIYPFVWLDQSINISKENLAGQKLIQSTIDRVKTFEKANSCEEYIRSISSDERIILIVSGGLGREITPKIHQLRQVSAIFVYCLDKSIHEQWAKQYKKVKRILRIRSTNHCRCLDQRYHDKIRTVDRKNSIGTFKTMSK